MKTYRITKLRGSRTAVAGAILGGTAAMAGCTADMSTLSQGGAEGLATEMSAISTPGWTGTWGAPPASDGHQFQSNTTLRQTVHTSISGSTLRVQLSNVFGNSSVTISDVHVAKPTDSTGATVDLTTDKKATFGGQTSVTLAAGQTVASDAVGFAVSALEDITVSFFLAGGSGTTVTSHGLGYQDNYLYVGSDQAGSASLPSGKTAVQTYYYLMGVDVQNTAASGMVVALGASITDGYTTSNNANQRWTDDLAVRLNNAGMTVGVLNEGICANQLLVDGSGQSAIHRFSRDVVNQSGVKWVVMSDDPINDIQNSGQTNSSTLISGLQTIISDAHNAGLKIVCSTLTPFKNDSKWTTAGETARDAYNAFVVGGSSGCDAILDQDKATHDPSNIQAFLPAYDSGDHLHPNAAGYQAIANAFDLAIFTGSSTALSRSTWATNPGTSASSNSSAISNMFDGSLSTRWSTDLLQTASPAQWLKLDLGSSQSFSKIVLDVTDSSGDYPRGYTVDVSNDNSTWTRVATGVGSSAITTISFATVTDRYIKINQTGTASNYWSVDELNVYK
jgi:lysophospholipase L1-like esterase